jgi:hypothetical protein
MAYSLDTVIDMLTSSHLPEDIDNKLLSIYVKCFPYAIANIPVNRITQELCDLAVTTFPDALQYIPEEFQSDQMIRNALQRDGEIIRHLPLCKRDAFAEIAVESSPNAIQYLSKRTYNMCKAAILKDGMTIRHITENYPLLEQLAIQTTPMAMIYLAGKLSLQDYVHIMKKDGMLLRYVPNKTPEIVMEAVKQNSLALQFAPESFHTSELYDIAISNPDTIEWMCYPSENHQLAAVKANGLNIKHIRVPTDTVKREAILQNPTAIRYVNGEYYALLAVAMNGLTLEYIREQTIPVCLSAVAQNPNARQFVKICVDFPIGR